MTDAFPILDIIIAIGGIYLLWSAVQMKTQNKIPGMLVSKGLNLSKAKDIEGFTKAMFYPTVFMGIVAALSGGLGIACLYIKNLDMIQFIMLILSFVMLIVFGYLTVRNQKKYLE